MYDDVSNIDLSTLDFGNLHGYKLIKNRNKKCENIPSLKIGNKRRKTHKEQKIKRKNGSVVQDGSDDYNRRELRNMNNVNGQSNRL